MNKKLMSLSLSIAAALMLTACSVDSSDDSSSDNAVEDPAKITPSAKYTCEKTADGETNKWGADGDLKIECDAKRGVLVFNDNINEIKISQVVTTMTVDFVEADGEKVVATVINNLKEGTKTIKGNSSKDGDVNCVEKFDTSVTLPETVSDTNRIGNFVYFEHMEKTNTTCPDWIDDEDDSEPKSAKFQMNSIITDENGKVSHYSTYSGN